MAKNTNATKQCRSCKSEIDAKASKCSKCGSKQGNWMRRHPIMTGLLGIILFFIIIGVANSGSSQKVGSNGTSSQSSNSTQQKNVTYKIGDKVKMGDVILTVNNVSTSQGSTYSTPSDGNQWVDLNVTLENTGSSQQYITTLGQMYVLDGKSNQFQVTPTDKAMENPGSYGLDGAIVAGAKKTGWVGFEVPKTATGLKFQYNASFYNDQSILVDLGM